MKLLLDTHIWIWNELEPWKIVSDVNREFANPENQMWLSPVSIWECVVLLEKKRISLRQDFRSWVDESVRDLQLQEAPLSWEVAHELRYTMLEHRDPADRFLVATAKVYELTLVTADERLMNVPGLRVLPNR
ncbi:MAG: type II toxin-antitoxin system VapC family toxin [Candidatus Acidiferrum sp.]